MPGNTDRGRLGVRKEWQIQSTDHRYWWWIQNLKEQASDKPAKESGRCRISVNGRLQKQSGKLRLGHMSYRKNEIFTQKMDM